MFWSPRFERQDAAASSHQAQPSAQESKLVALRQQCGEIAHEWGELRRAYSQLPREETKERQLESFRIGWQLSALWNRALNATDACRKAGLRALETEMLKIRKAIETHPAVREYEAKMARDREPYPPGGF